MEENKKEIEVMEEEEIEVIESTNEITTENLVRKKSKSNLIGLVAFSAFLLIFGVTLGSRLQFTSKTESVKISCVGGREYSEDNGMVDYEVVGKSLVIYLQDDEKVVFSNKDMCIIEGD